MPYDWRGVVSIPKFSPLPKFCYLCGKKEAVVGKLQEEHVIPKILFKPHFPKNYVLLWACNDCNQKVKKPNDDYIVRHLQKASHPVPTARAGWESAMRGFNKGHGVGILADIRRHISEQPVTDEDDNYIGNIDALNVPRGRVETFFITIAKGLWVRHANQLFDWEEYEVKIILEQEGFPTQLSSELLPKLVTLAPFMEQWEDQFAYAGLFVDRSTSAWCMMAYSSFYAMLLFTRKKTRRLPFRDLRRGPFD